MPSTTRQALLQALSAAGGEYISGQQLAGQLGVSRAAVHKAAAALTAQGYALEAVSRRGYRLLGGDPFCAEAVGPYPAPVQVYDTLESSNRTAKLLALDGAPHGTLVLTAHQSAGRGRLGRVFEKEFDIDELLDNSDDNYNVYLGDDGVFIVEGERIDKMLGYTNLESEKGFNFFQKFMKSSGAIDRLEELGIEEGDTVRVGDYLEFDYYRA